MNNDNVLDNDLVATNGLGKKVPVNLAWLEHDECVNNSFESSKSKSKKKARKPSVKTSRPVTRSQKKVVLDSAMAGNSTLPPGTVTRSKKQINRSK